MANSTVPVKAALLNGLGSAEIIDVSVASGDTSAAVRFAQPHTDPRVFVVSDYAAAAYITSVTAYGCTVNFSNPGADKTLSLLVIG